jgi:hypothetical protein
VIVLGLLGTQDGMISNKNDALTGCMRMVKQSVSQKPPPKTGSEPHPSVESVLQQINTMDSAELSEVLRAIARRINPPNHGFSHRTPD